jgi:hypothetical protein
VEIAEEVMAGRLAVVLPHLDERQRRMLAGAEARALGRGGIALVARATGMSRSTVQKGAAEVDAGVPVSSRVRRLGAGRKQLIDHDPGLLGALDDLVEPTARGDPAAPLRWTAKSVRALAGELTRLGHRVSPSKVGQLLAGLGYSLQAPTKQNEGAQYPDRDAQFRYVNQAATAHLAAGQPVISVDTKKKEVVGNLANKGREWQPKGEPVRVDVHDFPDPKVGKAIPYGVYDVGANQGFVSVGADADTAAFAVATIGRWWDTVGSPAYPRRAGCSSPPTPGDPTDTAAGCGSGSLGALAARTGRRSPSATSRPAPASGTASSAACSATSP